MTGRNLKAVVVAAVAALGGLALPFSASAVNSIGLVNGESGRCLDADTNTLGENGTKVQLWACHSGKNQQWAYNWETRTLTNVASGRCLDADLGNDDNVQLWDCHGFANQQWLDDPDGLTLRNVAYDLCLSADTDNTDGDGARVELLPCDDAPARQWKFIRG
jgi:Ricin-type beta-trefoil lectin domain